MATILGTNGADKLSGSAGDDTIIGGSGADVLTGGGGADTFLYRAVSDSPQAAGWDVISDFSGGRDKIDLSALLTGRSLVWAGTTPTAYGVWYEKSGDTTFIFVDTDGTAPPEMRIELDNSASLTPTVADFIGVHDGPNTAAPQFTSPPQFTVQEQTTTVGTVTATDSDSPSLSFHVLPGDDGARFSIDPNSGVLSFNTPPSATAPADIGQDNIYHLLVQVSDGSFNTAQWISVNVLGIGNAPPVITSPIRFITPEHQAAVTTLTAKDADTANLSWSLIDGGDSSQFSIDARTGALTFKNAPDYARPADANHDNAYDLRVQVSDGFHAAIGAVTVDVAPVNASAQDVAPAIHSPSSFSIVSSTTAVGNVVATDPDSPVLFYSIDPGNDGKLFSIDSQSGALRFVSAPDYAAPADINHDNVYDLTVRVSDGNLSALQPIHVQVANAYNQTLSGNGDANVLTGGPGNDVLNGGGGGDVLTGGAGKDLFVYTSVFDSPQSGGWDRVTDFTQGQDHIDLSRIPAPSSLHFTGTTPSSQGVWYEKSGVNTLIMVDTDGVPPPEMIIELDNTPNLVPNANDFLGLSDGPSAGPAPTFHSPAAFTMPENQSAIGTVAATALKDGALSYSLAGGDDVGLFAIDPRSGALSFVNAPDYEAPRDAGHDNVYHLQVQASDGMSSALQNIAVTVANVNDNPPVFTSPAAVTALENIRLAAQLAATDADGDHISYKIVGGVDAARFNLGLGNASDRLWFNQAPDHEAPADANHDNVYQLTVAASDGLHTVTQDLSITVGNVDDVRPVFTSPDAFHIRENSVAVGVVHATDADGPTPQYHVAPGEDGKLFTIDSNTGALAFVNAPDYEHPNSVSGTNDYHLWIQAGSDPMAVAQHITVSVGDVQNEPITGAAGDDALGGTARADSFDISSGGNDTVSAGAGDDTIYAGAAFNAADRIDGGAGNDTLDLNGDYAKGVIFEPTTLSNVENIVLHAGHGYNLTLSDATVSKGTLAIDGSALGENDTMRIDGSAETESSYTMTGGAGDDTLIGGAGRDYFDLSHGGKDSVSAGAGDDTIYAGAAFNAGDHVDGGAGFDTLYLNGDYGGLGISAAMLSNVERIVLQGNGNYTLTMGDSLVASGEALRIDGRALGANSMLHVDASAETHGASYVMWGGRGDSVLIGGSGNDAISGGPGNDTIRGGAGDDVLTGGGGNDTFVYTSLADAGTGHDVIADFSRSGAHGKDILDLSQLLRSFQGYNGTIAFSGGYLRFDTSNHVDTVVQVDPEGGGKHWTTLVTLQGTLLNPSDVSQFVV